MRRFHPERVQAVLNPDRHGNRLPDAFLAGETEKLWTARAEMVAVDARSRDVNGLILADFFDFT